ncbi:hypothetical protein QI633_07465 [Nocardioides sp. QY071]|uniref:hypothetical protein n=1 Tax=Nocardioides sp. QY071 TaxID=3044187 RepID=UPI00249BB439|nr:hypothetical protein [Nocardioides sp. QY071]WGY03596.1 hypothetical protein QI633_07465 [Nocardioides sp. QY071]
MAGTSPRVGQAEVAAAADVGFDRAAEALARTDEREVHVEHQVVGQQVAAHHAAQQLDRELSRLRRLPC